MTLVGYAGGLWRKKWLLGHENKIANGVQTLF
jgi:methylated-DNA-[protein]-cysteine S-methyltransferase